MTMISVVRYAVIIRSAVFFLVYLFFIFNSFSLLSLFPILFLFIFVLIILKISMRSNLEGLEKSLDNIGSVDILGDSNSG